MKKVIVILPRGEAIKNFVYSGITDALRQHYEIIFFSVVPNEEMKAYLISKSDSFYELKESKMQHRFAEEIKHVLQIAHANKLNSVTGNLKIIKDDLESKKSFKSNIIRSIRKKVASFYVTQDHLNNLTNRFIKANFTNPKVEEYENILDQISPDLVFNTSHIHNSISLELMYAANKLQIKTAAFLFSWDNLTSQGRILPNYDYYFTWNNKIKMDVLKYYPKFKSTKVFVTGTPQIDFKFNKHFIYSNEKLYKILKKYK
jgi:hypothetical protein